MTDRLARAARAPRSCAASRGGRARAARARPPRRALRRARSRAQPLHACSRSTPPPSTARCCAAAVGLAEAYMDGLWSSPDLVALVRVGGAQRRRRSTARAAGCARCIGPARRARARAQHVRPQPPADRRPLRPRQRALRAVPRRDDDVLVRRSSTRPDATLEEAQLAQARARLPQARPRARRPPARDRHRLGRARRPRRRALRLPRHHHDDLARAARPRRRARRAPRAWRTASPCCCATTATSRAATTSSSSIEMIEAVGWKDFDTFFARCSDAAGARRARCSCRRSPSTTAPTTSRRRDRSFIATLHLPRRLPALAARSSPAASARRTDLRAVGLRGHHRRLRARRCATGAGASSRAWTSVAALGYDERFRRLWKLYLAYCEAGFRERRIARRPDCCWPSRAGAATSRRPAIAAPAAGRRVRGARGRLSCAPTSAARARRCC